MWGEYMNGKPLTQKQIDRITYLYELGTSMKKISVDIKANYNTVQGYIRKNLRERNASRQYDVFEVAERKRKEKEIEAERTWNELHKGMHVTIIHKIKNSGNCMAIKEGEVIYIDNRLLTVKDSRGIPESISKADIYTEYIKIVAV